jgi:hypothetical protein
MKKQLIVITLLSLFLLIFALFTAANSPPEEEWSQTYGGINDDIAYSVQQTSDGGYMMAGSTGSFGASGKDVYLIKTNAAGEVEWSKTYGGTGIDTCFSAQQTSDEGYIMAGYTYSFGAHGRDFYLVKTDAAGNWEWHQVWGGPYEDNAYSVQQTSDNGYIVTGKSMVGGSLCRVIYLIKTDSLGNEEWTRTFSGGCQVFGESVRQTSEEGYIIAGCAPGPNDSRDAYLLKTDPDGNEEWSKTFSGTYYDHFHSVQQTADGGYIAAGETRSSRNAPWDVYLIKTDSTGNEEWSKTLGGTKEDRAYSVRQTPGGGYIIAGATCSSEGGDRDFYLLKTDAAGNWEWSKVWGGSGEDVAESINQTSDGGYILTGATKSLGVGGFDCYLIKFSSVFINVLIDIKPGSDPNVINLGSKGNVPVAIFSTPDFDAASVDPATVTLAGAHIKLKRKGTPMVNFEDVNGDSLPDVVVHIDTPALQLSETDTEASLEGKTYDGTPFRGVDTVRIAPK